LIKNIGVLEILLGGLFTIFWVIASVIFTIKKYSKQSILNLNTVMIPVLGLAGVVSFLTPRDLFSTILVATPLLIIYLLVLNLVKKAEKKVESNGGKVDVSKRQVVFSVLGVFVFCFLLIFLIVSPRS